MQTYWFNAKPSFRLNVFFLPFGSALILIWMKSGANLQPGANLVWADVSNKRTDHNATSITRCRSLRPGDINTRLDSRSYRIQRHLIPIPLAEYFGR